MQIEVLSGSPEGGGGKSKQPLVFIHGSGAGGWIFDEHWLEFFASQGFPALAVSLHGSAATGTLNGSTEPVKISDHVDDLKSVASAARQDEPEAGNSGSLLRRAGTHQAV